MSVSRWWTSLTGRGTAPTAETVPPSARSAPAPVAPPAPVPAAAAEAIAAPAETPEQRRMRFFCWLVDVPLQGAAAAPRPAIAKMLAQLDVVIASESLRAALLPRAPHVVPQLMKMLRDEQYSSVDVADRIAKDPVLTAEVVRSASSVFGGSDGGAEIDLARAVNKIGVQGLRRAIASVVLRPIFDARGDTLSAHAAPQVWQDADRKARLGAALATVAGLDPLDGYLAGLLHNSGWTAVLRAIDGFTPLAIKGGDLARTDVLPALLQRRDRLFGAIAGPWQLSPAMNALAAEVGRGGLESAQTPLGVVLREADRLATLRALAPPGQSAAASVPGWDTLARPVQDAYAGLAN